MSENASRDMTTPIPIKLMEENALALSDAPDLILLDS